MSDTAPRATAPLPGSLEHWAAHTPNAPALCEGTRWLSYAEWNTQADRLAEVLAADGGVTAGENLALCMHNRLEWFVTQAAAAKLGARLVPISSRLTPAEVHYIAADCGSRVLLFDSDDAEALCRVWTDQPPTERASAVRLAIGVLPSTRSDVRSFAALVSSGPAPQRLSQRPPRSIVYTSGTTGRPRGVVHARPAPTTQAPSARRRTTLDPPSAATSDLVRNLLGAPLNHAAGQASARATHAIGGCVYIMPRFDAATALALIDREKITTSFLVPTMLNRIVNLPRALLDAYDVSSIVRLATGASPCPQSIKEQVIAYFGAHCLVEGYGTTEVGIIARMHPDDHLTKPGSCGRVLDEVDVQIRADDGRVLPAGEVGEIFVRSPHMIERYLNEAPPEELVDGYFATGDMGRFDTDDYLYVVDRKKDMIIGGGVNIYPAEIEDVLRKHTAVLDAAVFGIPHPDLGEQVKAVVELVPDQRTSEAELIAFVSDHLAPYKRPRSIDIVPEIPRNPAGKVLKRQLREPYWDGTGSAI
ncbi:MAG: AMP-binding protein [Polyangiales bacterium]